MQTSLHLLVAMQSSGAQTGAGSFLSTIIMFVLIFLIFWLLIIRPQQKRQKERQKMLDSVKKGDKVITIGGVHGTVVGIDEKTLLIQIADNVKVKYERSAVSQIIREGVESPTS
ncbi:MAG: preprotein translocase subunit YajC [Bacteroidota bacterium]